MKRPSYRDAVNWLAFNDDNTALEEPEFGLSVAASVVRDIFGVEEEKLRVDIRKEIRRQGISK